MRIGMSQCPDDDVFQLISGQYVCPSNYTASPQVEVQLYGIPPVDCAKQKSKTVSRNAVNPVWNDQFMFQVGLGLMVTDRVSYR